MTRDEWYKSQDFIKLRFLNNMAAGIQHKTQEFNDVLDLILADHPEHFVYDKFTIVERQNRVVALEAKRLWDVVRDLCNKLEPKQFDEPKNEN